jgi:ABC-type transport system involved in cytochrome c biogenesis permease component
MRLETKEKIIFKVHPHWLYVVAPEIALVILGFIFLKLAYALTYWILTLFISALIFTMLVVFLDWLCINYYSSCIKLPQITP